MKLQVRHIITKEELERFMKARGIKSKIEGKKKLRAYFESVAEGAFYDEFPEIGKE